MTIKDEYGQILRIVDSTIERGDATYSVIDTKAADMGCGFIHIKIEFEDDPSINLATLIEVAYEIRPENLNDWLKERRKYWEGVLYLVSLETAAVIKIASIHSERFVFEIECVEEFDVYDWAREFDCEASVKVPRGPNGHPIVEFSGTHPNLVALLSSKNGVDSEIFDYLSKIRPVK